MANNEKWISRKKVGKHGGDLFKLDTKTKTPEQNVKEIIQGLYLKKTVKNETSPTKKQVTELKTTLGLRSMNRNGSDNTRLSYLNALVTLLCKEDRSNLGFTIDELMKCIRISLVDESIVIRTAALRVLRYLIKTDADVATFNNLRLPHLVTRSIDLMFRNEEERAQALRVIRRVVAVVGATGQAHQKHRAAYIDQGLLRCLTAVARAGSMGDSSGDRLARPAIATLAEICVVNPKLFISCGGVNAVTRQLAECATPRMAEALCGVLLHTLNAPNSRHTARIDLTCLSSPYCDFHFRPVSNDTTRDEREMRFTCSRLSLLCVLRSWPGLLHFCHPCTGGLHALVAALYLPRLEVRKAILDLLYELVGLPQPEWTDEISVALNAVDPSDFQDSWRLNEGFVAAEGTAILPHLSATGPDITEIHLALLLQCFLEAGLLDGLAEVIVTSDTFISVRATVLLGQLMHLIHLFLPLQISPALPSLMSQASAGKPQALAAIAALRRLHSMHESRPASYSLFLDHIIQYCSGIFKEKHEDISKSRKEKDNANMAKPKDMSMYKDSIEFLNESDSENEPKKSHSVGSRADLSLRNKTVGKVTKSGKFFNLFERESDSLIRCTLVMQNKDGSTWNWEIIRTILKETNSPPLLNLNDSGYRAWVARIISYLKPSSNKYSHTDLTSTCHGHSATRAGCQLIRHLLRHNDFESQRLLEDLFLDISRQIEAIEIGRRAHECLFSPIHMCNTMCQMYFLFIGQLCHTHTGLRLLKKTKLYDNLLDLSTRTHHSCYVKLVISSLDYTLDSYPREILSRTLTCNIQASRLYATQFLNVLLRASHKSRDLVRRRCKHKKSFIQERFKACKEDSENTDSQMDTWVLQMLVGQVKDESKSVVKCALAILEEAYCVPGYPEKLAQMREAFGKNCRLERDAEPAALDFAAVGDSGYLLWLSLEMTAASQSNDPKSKAFIKKHLDFWDRTYNYRYVRLIEGRVHAALTLCEARRCGVRVRRPARVPPHVLAACAGRRPPVAHYRVLQNQKCDTEQEILDLKASMWALGNYSITPHGFRQLMTLSNGHIEDSVPLYIVKLAKNCPVYSLRATALYVLGMIGSTFDGANLLAELGWLSVRHTRHDQFPILLDELYTTSLDNASTIHLFTSPDRRCNLDFTEISEHSDHTDQSTADSLPSDNPKHKDGEGDQDQGFKEPDKRKSHTLPTQGCSSTHERPTMSESRTVDILRDCSNYERPAHRLPIENRMLIGRINSLDNAHEGRVRNTSESSTSGVSSCDSFLGKYAMPDRVLTLSPIPSSSSLYGMKSSSSSHRPRLSESLRRTSTSSFTAPDVASSPPTSLDMTGYATLMSLNKNRRPHLSESAASCSSDVDDLSWLLSDSNKRHKTFSSLRERSKATKERMGKMSVLEYDWRPLPTWRSLAPRAAAAPCPPRAPRPPPATPAYIGICLPQHLASLLCNDEEDKDKDHKDERISNLRSQRFPSYLADTSIASNDNKMRTTPDSQKLSSRGIDLGASSLPIRSNIINTVATSASVTVKIAVNKGDAGTSPSTTSSGVASNATGKSEAEAGSKKNSKDRQSDKPMRTSTPVKKKSDSNFFNERELKSSMSKINIDKINSSQDNMKVSVEEVTKDSLKVIEKIDEKRTDSTTSTNSTTKANSARDIRNVDKTDMSITKDLETRPAITKWRHVPAECLACVRTRPPSAHELREAFFADINNMPDSVEEETSGQAMTPQAEVMNHAHFMSNPIHLKQTRTALLSLKQRHPDVFRDPCVYSDICALISRDTYMLCARRFLQELFLDTSFECFALEPTTNP